MSDSFQIIAPFDQMIALYRAYGFSLFSPEELAKDKMENNENPRNSRGSWTTMGALYVPERFTGKPHTILMRNSPILDLPLETFKKGEKHKLRIPYQVPDSDIISILDEAKSLNSHEFYPYNINGAMLIDFAKYKLREWIYPNILEQYQDYLYKWGAYTSSYHFDEDESFRFESQCLLSQVFVTGNGRISADTQTLYFLTEGNYTRVKPSFGQLQK